VRGYLSQHQRLTYFKVDTDKNPPSLNSNDEDSEEFDPESYYASDSGEEIPKEVKF